MIGSKKGLTSKRARGDSNPDISYQPGFARLSVWYKPTAIADALDHSITQVNYIYMFFLQGHIHLSAAPLRLQFVLIQSSVWSSWGTIQISFIFFLFLALLKWICMNINYEIGPYRRTIFSVNISILIKRYFGIYEIDFNGHLISFYNMY